ncbi:MAG: hypothetical protein ABIH23_36345, partial [bacterium]
NELLAIFGGFMKKVTEKYERSGFTMTVSELRDSLSKYADDMPVVTTWESVISGVRNENFTVEVRNGREELVIDVENYG